MKNITVEIQKLSGANIYSCVSSEGNDNDIDNGCDYILVLRNSKKICSWKILLLQLFGENFPSG